MTAVRVELRELRPLDLCTINGYTCEIKRQARRTTYVRIVEGDLKGAVVQLPRTQVVKV